MMVFAHIWGAHCLFPIIHIASAVSLFAQDFILMRLFDDGEHDSLKQRTDDST